MKRVFFGYLAIFALGISFLAAYAPLDREPGLSSQRGLEQVGLDAGSTANDPLRIDLAYPTYSNIAYDSESSINSYPGGYDQWIADLATNDVIVLGPQFVDTGLESESAIYEDAVEDIRAINSNTVITIYTNIVAIPVSMESYKATRWRGRLWEALDRQAYDGGSDGWARSAAGDTFVTIYGNKVIRFTPTVADTVAYYLLKMWETSTNWAAYTGPYFDFIEVTDPASWMRPGGDFTSYLDLDQDGTAYASDLTDERALFQAYQDSVLSKFQQGLAAIRGDNRFVTIGNGFGASSSRYGAYLDGSFYEQFDAYWPVSAASWDIAHDARRGNLNDSRLGRPLYMFESASNRDSSVYYVEAVALACLGVGNVYSENAIGLGRGAQPRPSGLPDAGESLGLATMSGDTLSREFENLTVWAIVDIDGVQNGTNTSPLPYLIISAEGDTLRRGGGWSRAADTTPPASPANIALVNRGADYVNISWDDNTEPDLSHYNIWRKQGTGLGSPTLFDEDITESYYSDTTVAADTTYYYAVTAVDDNGNESSTSQTVVAAHDTTAPSQITDLAVQGYYDEVDLIWTASAAADLDYYNLYRGTSSGSLSLFDTIESGNQGDYTDSTVDTSGDSTYYYAIAAVDSSGNEAADSNEVSATPEVTPLAWSTMAMTTPTIADTASGGNAEATITAQLNRAGFLRPLWRRHDGAYADWTDTTGMAWMSADSAQVFWSGDYDTGVPVATAAEDSGGIRLTWSAASSHDGYLLDMNVSTDGSTWGGWNLVSYIHPDSTGFTHAADDDTLTPRRGMLNYRMFAFTGTPGSETDSSGVALLDSIYYNQAVGVYGEFHAVEDTAEYYLANETPTVSSEDFGLWVTPAPPADTTPPDTSGVFVAVTVDTTDTDDVLLTLSDMTITGDPSQVQFEWSNDGGSNYYGDSSWSPASASTTVGDTISTNVSTENLNSDLYTRFRLRDDETTPNVSGWNVNAQVFERAAEAASGPAWTGTVVWSNNSTMTGYPASPDYEEASGLYQAAINLDPAESSDTTTDWGYINTSSDAPVYNEPYAEGEPDRFDLSQTTSGNGRRVALMCFGQADSIMGGTITSAELNMGNSNWGAFQVDSVFVWAATADVLQEWATENDDASWDYANTSESTAWSESLGGLTEADVLPYAAISGGDISNSTPWSIDVTELVQAYADIGGKIVFLITATAEGTNQGALIMSLRNHDTTTSSNRSFLEAVVAE